MIATHLNVMLAAALLAGPGLAAAQPVAPAAASAVRESDAQRVSSRELRRQFDAASRVTVPAELTRRGDEVVLQTSDRAIVIANPGFVGQQVRQLPVDAVVSPVDDGVRVRKLSLRASERWNALPTAQKARYQRLDVAQARVAELSGKALAEGSTEGDFAMLKQAVDQAEGEAVMAYMGVPEDDREQQRVLVEQHRELRRANKALYGFARDDRYPPKAYERIYANSRGAFALKALAEDKPRCSAVLIGERLALTNDHCILEEEPAELQAVFDYEDDLEGAHLPSTTYPVTAFRATDEELRGALDFLLLELGDDAEGKPPGARFPVQCLSTRPVLRDDPLYVIGYPLGAPRTVHDNAFVYFPHLASPAEYVLLEMLVKAEYDSIEEEDASYRDGKLKEFSESYQARLDDAGAVDHYEYVSVRFGNQPTIGADSDTYRGNSGSPVYSRRTHLVVGLLFDGQDDLSQPWVPGWSSHEAILPITQVIARLDAAAPDWRDDSGICLPDSP